MRVLGVFCLRCPGALHPLHPCPGTAKDPALAPTRGLQTTSRAMHQLPAVTSVLRPERLQPDQSWADTGSADPVRVGGSEPMVRVPDLDVGVRFDTAACLCVLTHRYSTIFIKGKILDLSKYTI